MRLTLWLPEGELTGELVSSVLELVSLTIPESITSQWTLNERRVAYDWAMREHIGASDNPVRRRDKPWFIKQATAITAAQRMAAEARA